jgi:hypothetical protein
MRNTTGKRVYDFQDRIKEQQPYIDRFIRWLELRQKVISVEVAGWNEDMNGIDLKVLTREEGLVEMQIKTDFNSHRTGNLCWETISQAYPEKEGVIGWGFYKLPEYIVYLSAVADEIHIFKTEELRGFIIKNYDKLAPFSTLNKAYTTLGSLFPIRLTERNMQWGDGLCKQVINLRKSYHKLP